MLIMNINKPDSSISETVAEVPEEGSVKDAAVATSNHQLVEDGQTSTYSTTSREQHRTNNLRLSLNKIYKEIKSCILSSEDDVSLQCTLSKGQIAPGIAERAPMFVIVDKSSCISDPSSKEMVIDKNDNITNREPIVQKYFNINGIREDLPSTSRDKKFEMFSPILKESESRDEMVMTDINLQGENAIALDATDDESIVISYLKNKDTFVDVDSSLITSRKKSSLLESVPKMETILEGEQFSPFSIQSKCEICPDVVATESREQKD